MMIVNEKYKLNKEWLDLLLEHKNNANVTFNLSNNDIRILLTCIEVLQQENARLKDKIDKVIKLMNSELTDVGMGKCEEIHISFVKHWLKILKEN